MARYIDADLLKEEIKSSRSVIKPEYLLIDLAYGIIDSQPTAKLTPCDVCAYNPPSSMDGKPCTMCPSKPKNWN